MASGALHPPSLVSPSAGFVITVIIDHVDHSGINAWKTSGADLRAYGAGLEAEEEAP